MSCESSSLLEEGSSSYLILMKIPIVNPEWLPSGGEIYEGLFMDTVLIPFLCTAMGSMMKMSWTRSASVHGIALQVTAVGKVSCLR